jgi:hypothetical protein
MDNSELDPGSKWTQDIWQAAEKLTSQQVETREEGLDYLIEGDYARESPLIAYLIGTRIADPDLEFRFHVIKAIGSILTPDDNGVSVSAEVISHLQIVIAHLNRGQILNLLAVAEHYLAAESMLVNIFKLSSYAGSILSDIVNDQKMPISIRQQAIFFCGEVGFLESLPTLEGLINRVEKRKHQDDGSATRKRDQKEANLYPFALAAVGKLRE